MDTPETPTPGQNVAFLHENGEMQEARDAEAAVKLCPFLGKMSLEEVGLLLELQTMGHAAMEEEPVSSSEDTLSDEAESESLFSQVFVPTKSAANETVGELEHPPTEEVITIPQESTQQNSIDVDAQVEQQFVVGKTDGTPSSELISDDALQPVAPEPSPVISATQETPAVALAEAPQGTVAIDTSEQFSGPQHSEEIRAPLKIVSTSRPAAYRSLPIAPSPASSINNALPTLPIEKPIEIDTAAEGDKAQRTSPEVNLLPVTPETPINEHRTETDVATLLPESPEGFELEYIANDEGSETPAIVPDLLHELENSDTGTKQRANKIIREIIAAPVSLEAPGEDISVSPETQLEQLVTELLVTLNIECSPQDFKSYVAATRTYLLEETAATKTEQDDAIRRLSREIGTNEFLDQVQQYFIPVKSKNSTLSSIGKSILRLYERIAPITAS